MLISTCGQNRTAPANKGDKRRATTGKCYLMHCVTSYTMLQITTFLYIRLLLFIVQHFSRFSRWEH